MTLQGGVRSTPQAGTPSGLSLITADWSQEVPSPQVAPVPRCLHALPRALLELAAVTGQALGHSGHVALPAAALECGLAADSSWSAFKAGRGPQEERCHW